jgi:hypothetical protein
MQPPYSTTKRSLLLVGLALILFIGASRCAVLEVGILQTPQPVLGLTATLSALKTQNAHLAGLLIEATRQAESTPRPPDEPDPPAGPEISPTILPQRAPRFSNVRFSTQPEAIRPRRFYVAYIPRLYAVWDYQNMGEGMTVQRVWRHNGEIWLTREETWNFALLGTEGTMRGVSIFDLEEGLPPGEFTLSLYIDGAVQDVLPDPGFQEAASFWLFPPEVTGPIQSADRQRTARVENGTSLTIQEPNGEVNTLAIAQEISAIQWFPDSRTLLYVDRDRTGQVAPDRDEGLSHRLWRVDVVSGERSLLAGAGENFHNPLISPTGRFISALAGPTRVDEVNCQASPELVILELDVEYRRSGVYSLGDFATLPAPESAGPQLALQPPTWETAEQLSLGLYWPCPVQLPSGSGIYLLDLRTRVATRLE